VCLPYSRAELREVLPVAIDLNSAEYHYRLIFESLHRLIKGGMFPPSFIAVGHSLECAGQAALWSNREMSQPRVVDCLGTNGCLAITGQSGSRPPHPGSAFKPGARQLAPALILLAGC
jgi:hypothetical protein